MSEQRTEQIPLDTLYSELVPRKIAQIMGENGETFLRIYRKGARRTKRGLGYDYQTALRVLDMLYKAALNLKLLGYKGLDNIIKAVDFLKTSLTLPDLVNTVTPETIAKKYGEDLAEALKLFKEIGQSEAKKAVVSIYELYSRNFSSLIDAIVRLYLERVAEQAPVTIILTPSRVGEEYKAKVVTRGKEVEALLRIRASSVYNELSVGLNYEFNLKVPSPVVGSAKASWLLAAAVYPEAEQITRGKAFNRFKWRISSDRRLTLPELQILLATDTAARIEKFKEVLQE